MKINCQVRQASSNVDAKHYDTERIRKEYLVQNIMVADEINMVYSMFDRIISGGAVPVKEDLLLSAPEILRADYFTQRRELGIINVGGWFELFFVNTLGMKFNTGVIVYIFLLIAVVLWAIYESHVDRSQMRQNIAFVLSVGMLGIPFFGLGIMSFIIGVLILAVIWVVCGVLMLIVAQARYQKDYYKNLINNE